MLKKLDELDSENTRLKAELEQLRVVVKDLRASIDQAADQTNVQAQRISDLAQTKVESAQKLPLRLSGLILMNAYRYTGHVGEAELPMVGILAGTRKVSAGATIRQTQISAEYESPSSFIGANLSGRLQMDFFAGSLNNSQNHLARIRVANVALNWARRSISAGIDKPILSPREPATLAQLGISPLANSGNLWLWQPQIRYEERLRLGNKAGLDLRAGVYQTNETFTPAGFTGDIERSRPAFQGRFELYRTIDDNRRLAIAPGFHFSESRINGTNLQSHAVSLDFGVPMGRLEWAGFAFSGQNLTGLGISGIRQQFTIENRRASAVHVSGGWTQLSIAANSKFKFHLFGGIHDDRNRDLVGQTRGRIAANRSYGANLRFLLAPNLQLGAEAMQINTTYFNDGLRLVNRYDLALAYFF